MPEPTPTRKLTSIDLLNDCDRFVIHDPPSELYGLLKTDSLDPKTTVTFTSGKSIATIIFALLPVL